MVLCGGTEATGSGQMADPSTSSALRASEGMLERELLTGDLNWMVLKCATRSY